MKISIITPIYNEEKNIKRYFDTILKLDYSKDDFELVFVNDWSSDNSLKILEEIKNKSDLDINLINFITNKWRAIAREEWVKKAKYDDLLFLDAKCEIFSDGLSLLSKLNYNPIIWNPIQKKESLIDNFLYIIRSKLYKWSFWDNFKDIMINKDNFDKTWKWTGIFFVKKNDFLKSIPSDKWKNISDDTKLLKNIIEKKDILKTSKLKVYYNVREWFWENIKHIYERWPKFVDYYYNIKNKYFWLINFFIILYILFCFLLYIDIKFILLMFIFIIILWLYFANNIKDFLIVISVWPIIIWTFFIWIIKWIYLKLIWKLWN